MWINALLVVMAWAGGVTVATVGDSFADSLYNAMRSRPDLVAAHGVRLERWSRPIIGLTRADYFDYAEWLRNSAEIGRVDVCFVQIGSNDMQSIPAAGGGWLAYGSPAWRSDYARRTREMAEVLSSKRCGLVVWVLQPGFEMRDLMACHRELINEVQREAAGSDRTRVLEIATSESAYGKDKTHFNREYLLKLGPVLYQIVDNSGQLVHRGCLACHRGLEGLATEAGIFPLRPWRREQAATVWAPDRVGVQCRMEAPKRVRPKARRGLGPAGVARPRTHRA